MSEIHNSNNPMDSIGMQSHGFLGGMMTDYNGTAAHLEQQMYENPQSTPHNETVSSNVYDSNNSMDLIGMQSHGFPERMMTDYNGTAAHLEQQMYENPQSTPHNETVSSNVYDSNNSMDLIGMQSHGFPERMMTDYNGTAAHLEQQIYENPQPSPQNERRFQCDQCPLSFSYCDNLTRHKRSHARGGKPFKCDQCSRTFNRIGDMKKHKKKHPTEAPFVCEYCEKKFGWRWSLLVSFSRVNREIRNLYFPQKHQKTAKCHKESTSSSGT